MAKDVSFVIAAPPSGALLERMGDFLVTRAAKRAGVEASGTFRKRAAGETGYPVKPPAGWTEGVS